MDDRTLRITVARSGGVAGITPSWSITASEEPEVDSWLSLVESCPWDAPGPEADADGADRFVYSIRVLLPTAASGSGEETGARADDDDEHPPSAVEAPDADPTRERDARVPEAALQGPWRELVDRVKQASAR
ncbi:protealysin inhibitor emfourin [Herbiconiux sp. 11R-BC]|uniref:protealysin inhibitor emfourin n=1 Tax=Herbiconiux sp. 11R-BC TaxID=3111637 RepID=UPI003C0C1F80